MASNVTDYEKKQFNANSFFACTIGHLLKLNLKILIL